MKTQAVNLKYTISIFRSLLIVFSPFLMVYAEIPPVNDRTPQVREAIIAAAGVTSATDVTETHLTTITSLNLRSKGITALKSGDLSGLTGLTTLNLYGNMLSKLPDGIFEGLTALTTLRLGGNTVHPLPITVSLERVGDSGGRFKAVVPTGSPFDIVLPVSVTNGSIVDSATTLTIAKGSVESDTLTVTRTAGTTDAVTADIGTLPNLPSNHYGYTLSKSDDLPIEVIGAVVITPPVDPVDPPDEVTPLPVKEAAVPVFTDGIIAIRSVVENTASDVNIGTAIAATDANDDSLSYTLSGTDAAAFEIDSATGQLKTSASLDYEIKSIYTVAVTVSDGSLTNTITVIVSVIDVADMDLAATSLPVSKRTPQVRDAIVAAVSGITSAEEVTGAHLAAITSLNLRSAGISELKSGDFAGLTGLTSLNLYGNLLSILPNGIFEGLISLTTLRLGGNTVAPMPLLVSLQQVSDNQFRAVISTGAPFDIVLPINNSLMVTIPKGSVTSESFTYVGTPSIGELPVLPANHFGYILAKSDVCNRTLQVIEAITDAVPDVTDCRNVSNIHLATITTLNLSGTSITSLDASDFSGLLSLTTLNLSNNQLTNLPNGIFVGLTSLDHLNLSGNSVSSIPLTVTLEKVGENQVRAVVPPGAPFDMNLQISVENGSIGVDNIMISKGSAVSVPFLVNRTAGTTDAVTVDIETMPSLPATHSGYTLVKPDGLPLEIFKRINVAPMFTDGSSTTRVIAENTAAGIDISTAITATDANDDTLTYSLGGTDASSFAIETATGQLKTKASLDYETKNSYSVMITVSDGSLTDTINITINVTDVDENRAPVFTEGTSTTRSIAENTATGENIGEPVAATDADDDTLTYSLGGTDATAFAIDSATGQLKTKASLDYEIKNSYSVMITVSDGNLTDTINVTINVTDVDENRAPVFTEGTSATRPIAENTAAGENIGEPVAATDTNDDPLTYSIGGTDASSFAIDTATGQLKTKASLDYETKNSYSVVVTVSDGNLTDTINVTIYVTDVDEKTVTDSRITTGEPETTSTNNAPEFTDGDSITRSVAENTGAGVDIGKAVSATDTDGHTLTYTLGGLDKGSFSIDSTTGQLRTDASLDYETKSSYSVTITVSDGNNGTDSISVTINVTDVDETPLNNVPVFSDGDSTTRSITENTGSGVNIGTAVSASDTDGDTLTYTLSGTDAGAFSIDSSSGQLRTSASLDYETKFSYSVTISVSDGNGGSDSITVTINVSDVDETPTNTAPEFTGGSSTTLTVTENTGPGVDIGGAVAATDADNDELTYSLSGTDASSFSIDSYSGQLKTSETLDYESKSSYSVSVTASDGTDTDSISVTINVTNVNEAPAISDGDSTTRSIAENVAADINIGSAVSAVDPEGSKLTYTLGGTDIASFSLDSTKGQLKTKATLDYESKKVYSVTITVSDGSLTDSITVTINITNLDETPSNNPPVFTDGTSTKRSIVENTAADKNIGTPIAATDADNNRLAYLLSGTDASSFSIDDTNGQLKTNAALNHETKSSYTVVVTVTDGSDTDTITVTINVTDVNEAPVIAANTDTTLSIAENTAARVNIGGALSATDPDDGDTLTYSLGGTDASSFDIVNTTGQLQTKTALDYETKARYLVTIIVSDGTLTDTIDITINVSDVDENREPVFTDGDSITINVADVDENRAPVFTDGDSTTRSVAENTGSGVNIGSVIGATDADDDDLTYSLGGTDAASFSIDSSSGQLRTKAALDYETKDSYSVTITVSDGTLTDEIDITINVADVDENRAPVFTDGDSTTRSVAENTGSGVNIGSAIGATDADDDTLTYSLGGTDAASFGIDSSSGHLRTKAALDYETKDSYSVTITVSDGTLTDEIDITINVADVDENRAPVFTDGDSITRSVAENTGSGVNIGSAIGATDADDDDLTYSFSGTDAASFSINTTNGQLLTRSAINYETKTSYSLTITVSDGNGGRDSITVTISVTDVDENRTPEFTDGDSTTRSVVENTESEQNIGDPVAATDADNDTLTYTLSGTDATSFSIVNTSGQLQTNAALDYETKTSYTVTISVSDGNSGEDEITVTINVTDVTETIIVPISERTSHVRNAIVKAAGVDSAEDVTSEHLQQIDDLNLYNKKMNTLKVGDFSGMTALRTLSLYYTGLKSLPAGVFDENTELRSIELGGCYFTTLPAGVFDNNTKLTYLSFGGSGLNSLRSDVFGKLTKLTGISLYKNDLTSLPAGVFDNNTKLKTLLLHFNGLTSLPAGVFDNNTKLTELYLYHNGLTSLPANVFDNNTKLTDLYLSDNDLTALSANVFDNNTKLTDLYLYHNDLTSLPANVFDNNTNLTYLSLDNNDLTALPANVFDNNINLTDLALNNNDLTALPANVFNNNTKLEWLTLNNNDLTSLPANVFDNNTELKDLWLSRNELTSLPTNVFDNNTKLEWLVLGSNALTSLPANVFDNNTNLRELALGSNDLTSLPTGVFDNNTKLKDLWIGSNALTSLPTGVFDNNTKLKKLSLSSNQISDVSELEGLTSLNTLYIIGNPISDYGPLRRLKENNPNIDINIDINNNPPVFPDGDSTTRSVAENTEAGQSIGTPVAATDSDTSDTLTYSLSGTDAASFDIVSTSGQLQTKATLDYEIKTSYTVTVSVDDGKNGLDIITVTINVTDVANAAPSVQTSPEIPDNTALLSNFPNPFNPETWIPYQLANASNVQITIYDARGVIVRRLDLGHQRAGYYKTRSSAAHWDGRNNLGERVANGIYVYQLQADSVSFLRKMVILK